MHICPYGNRRGYGGEGLEPVEEVGLGDDERPGNNTSAPGAS
jgi:hypothetical protein